MKQLITLGDLANIKPISANNKNKAGQIISEVQDLWLNKLLGQAFYDYIVSTDDDITDLMEGCQFTDCQGNTRFQRGLKQVLVYLFWSKYVYFINVVDTPTGMVSKSREDAEQLSMGHLKNLSSSYETMALNYFDAIDEYLKINNKRYPLYKNCQIHTAELRPTIRGIKKRDILR